MKRVSKGQIDKLEAEIRSTFTIPNLPVGFSYDAEFQRWDQLLDPLEAALAGDEESVEAVAEFVVDDYWRIVMVAVSPKIDVPPEQRQAAVEDLSRVCRAPVVVRHFLLSIPDVGLRRAAARATPAASWRRTAPPGRSVCP